MKMKSFLIALAFGASVFLVLLQSSNAAFAQPQQATRTQITANPSILSQQQELERLKQKEEIQNQVQEEVNRTLRKQVQEEFDSTFFVVKFLLPLQMSVLTALPVLLAIISGLVYKGVISKIIYDTKKQFNDEFQQDLKSLKDDLNAQRQKDEIIQELSIFIPQEDIFFQEQTTSQTQQRLQDLTSELENIKLQNKRLLLTVDDYMKWGDGLYYSGKYEEAQAQYEKAINIQPEAYKALFGKGNALRKSKKYKEAIQSYKEAIDIKGDYFVAWVNRGLANRRLPDGEAGLKEGIKEGIKCFNIAIAIAPYYYRAWYNKACYLALLGKYEQAFENLKEAIRLAPKRCRDLAQTDEDFNSIQEEEEFKKLVHEPTIL